MSEPVRQVEGRTAGSAAAFRLGPIASAIVLAILLTSCAARRPPPPPPTLVTGSLCLAVLAQRDAEFRPAAPAARARACTVENAVRVDRLAIPFNRPVSMACPLAVALDGFEREVVQPAALRHFGQSVARVRHFGAYDCRRENNRLLGRWSQHAAGNAIDIAGFELSDGTRVEVADDWASHGPRGAFLHELSKRACEYFMVVLTPDTDRAHANHFHFDVGPYRHCES